LEWFVKIKFIGHSYHQKTRSSRFFIEVLEGLGSVSIVWDDSWITGVKLVHADSVDGYDLVVVWQVPEAIAELADAGVKNLIFVPMYDAAYSLGKEFWRALWNVKVVCFSAAMYEVCRRYRVHCHYIRYFPDSLGEGGVGVGVDDNSLFLWQRRGYPSWETVAKYIPHTQFKRLHLHLAPDFPGELVVLPTDEEYTSLEISSSSWFEDKSKLIERLGAFSYFMAPREREGIGFSFLDAMCQGLIVLGLNFATLNEYVVHGVNGFLITEGESRRFDLPKNPEKIRRNSLHYMRKGRLAYVRHLPGLVDFIRQPWRGRKIKLHSKLDFALQSRSVKAPSMVRAKFAGFGPPLVSVVTVVRNDRAGIAKTFESVFAQSFQDFEYVVVDGASSDGTVSYINRHLGGVDQFLSEPDSGPYFAMQKGADLARGRYVIFMNSGDEFFDQHSLADAVCSIQGDPDIIYGHHFYIDDRGRPAVHLAASLDLTFRELKLGRFSHSWLSGVPCHQATFVKKALLVDLRFDTDYRIAADHHLLFRAVAAGATCYHTNTFVANYYAGGISAKNVGRCVDEWERIALEFSESPEMARRFYSGLRA
jgi:hypothetical protein